MAKTTMTTMMMMMMMTMARMFRRNTEVNPVMRCWTERDQIGHYSRTRSDDAKIFAYMENANSKKTKKARKMHNKGSITSTTLYVAMPSIIITMSLRHN